MSGIAAVLRRDGDDVSPRELEPIIARLRHRGSLDPYVWHTGNVALIEATALVRTTDCAVEDALATDGVHIVADVHLACRRPLIRDLRAAGRPAESSTSDRELLRQAYLEWGLGCVDRLAGEFAFIVWDEPRRRLTAVTDQMGARELYLSSAGETLVLSTEMLAVLEHDSVPHTLDERVIGHFLLFSSVRIPTETATSFAGVKRLLPAHHLQRDAGELRIGRYWDFPIDEPMLRYAKQDDYVAHFRSLLAEAVADRLEDVPRAVSHLSGGLDSTSVAVLAAEQAAAGAIGTELSALTVAYDRVAPDTEAFFANLVAQRAALPITFLPADEFVLRRPLVTRAEPAQDFAVGLTRRIEEATAAQGSLVLSGKGGDELLTTTPLYDVMLRHSPIQALRLYRWLWSMTGGRPSLGGYRNYLRGLARQGRPEPPVEGYPYPAWLDPEFVTRANIEELWWTAWRRPPVAEHRTQPDVARFLGGSGWNIRNQLLPPPSFPPSDSTFPFADLRLIKFVMALPPVPWNNHKRLLRAAMADSLPPEVLTRVKTPAPPFQTLFLQLPEASWVDDWPATETLERFVRRELVPPIYRAQTIERTVIDSRPMFLNEWLRALGYP